MIVSEVHRFSSSYYSRSGYAANVELESGERLVVSRYDDESSWVADGFYSASCSFFPVYWNGEGSRCTLLKVPNDDVQRELDRAVAEVRS